MDNSIHNQLVNRIKSFRRGNLLFTTSFLDIASEGAIRVSLSRLTKDGFLVRIANGIYLFPKVDDELGILYPSIEEVAEAIARKEKIRILPTGIHALNKLGLSTQVPTKVTYLTDGKSRNIKMGKHTLVFKRVVPKKLQAKGKISRLVIQALQELKKEEITPYILKRIEEVLKNEDPSVIRSDAKLAPAWIARILYNLTQNRI